MWLQLTYAIYVIYTYSFPGFQDYFAVSVERQQAWWGNTHTLLHPWLPCSIGANRAVCDLTVRLPIKVYKCTTTLPRHFIVYILYTTTLLFLTHYSECCQRERCVVVNGCMRELHIGQPLHPPCSLTQAVNTFTYHNQETQSPDCLSGPRLLFSRSQRCCCVEK